MNKYFTVTGKVFQVMTVYRFNFIFSMFSNFLYIIIIYFLWNSIYSSGITSLNGLTFNEVFVYLSLASIIFALFTTWVETEMSREVIEGSIVMHLVKPMDMQIYKLFESLGTVLIKLVTITIPSVIFIFIAFKPSIAFGFNLLFFLVSLVLAYIIKFNIDFMVGLLCFYNESSWGMSSAKDSIILLLSGAVIPLSFFPAALRSFVNFLPFQAIYNIPLNVLISKDFGLKQYLTSLIIQLGWIILLFVVNRLFYRKAIKVVIVNGG
jgi:ABC-2 type transport system permease protein